MRIALNWFEVSLPTSHLSVFAEEVNLTDSPAWREQAPMYNHRVVQRRGQERAKLLHLTETLSGAMQEETICIFDDPTFVKIAIEEGFVRSLVEKGFLVHRKHVGGTAFIQSKESLWPEIYTFLSGISFRGFYGLDSRECRWGLILNYTTSQRFCLSLENPLIRKMAIGRRVVPLSEQHDPDIDDYHTGILNSYEDHFAIIDFSDRGPDRVPLEEWTLPCRREILLDYVKETKGTRAGAELSRLLQQATFALTQTGRMNTSLAKDQLEATQRLLRDHDIGRFHLPLPSRPPASLNDRPLIISE